MLTFLMLLMSTDLSLTLNKEVTLTHDDITLADVLTVSSRAALDNEELLGARLARGPGFSSARTLNRSLVAQFIENAMPELKISFTGPNETLVHRVGGVYSDQAVERAVREFIAEQAESEELIIEVLRVQTPKVLKIPTGPLVYRVRARPNRPLIGRQAFYVDMMVNGENFQTLVVPVELAQKALVAVARRDLKRGETLGPSEITWESRQIEKSTAALLRKGELDGLCTRLSIKAGTVLTERHTEIMPLVQRKQNVYVTAQRGALVITLRAEALDNGVKGESIRLKNLESGQLIRGTVTAVGTVQLDF